MLINRSLRTGGGDLTETSRLLDLLDYDLGVYKTLVGGTYSVILGSTLEKGIDARYEVTGTLTLKKSGEEIRTCTIQNITNSSSFTDENIMFNCTNEDEDSIQVLFNPSNIGWMYANWTTDDYLYYRNSQFDEMFVNITGGTGASADGVILWFSNNTKEGVLKGTWIEKTWATNIPVRGLYVWYSGEDIYYSGGPSSRQYIFNKITKEWDTITYSGLTQLWGQYTFSDGGDTYYAQGNNSYKFNKDTNTWTKIDDWNISLSGGGIQVWNNGPDTYYSYEDAQYKFDSSTNTWSEVTWNGFVPERGSRIWTYNGNVYYSLGEDQYVLDSTTNTWVVKNWVNQPPYLEGACIWEFDGVIYFNCTKEAAQWYSETNEDCYYLDGDEWKPCLWSNYTPPTGQFIWKDNEGVVYSTYENNTYMLKESINSQSTSPDNQSTSSYSLTDLQGVWDTTGLIAGTMTVNSDGTFTDPEGNTGTFVMTEDNEFTATNVDIGGQGVAIFTYVWVFTDNNTSTITITGPFNATLNCTRRA